MAKDGDVADHRIDGSKRLNPEIEIDQALWQINLSGANRIQDRALHLQVFGAQNTLFNLAVPSKAFEIKTLFGDVRRPFRENVLKAQEVEDLQEDS
jgi:hypothetical protein